MSVHRHTFGVLFASFALATACSYDWGVGPASSTDAGGQDSGPETGVEDAAPEASATCLAVIEALDEQRAAAVQCIPLMVGLDCTETGKDECGCVVGGINPIPFGKYLSLVDEFKQNDCTRSCPGCATSITPKCTADDNGGTPRCE
jgi:hypothetical protein